MGKKTKREKILAEYHRKLRSLEIATPAKSAPEGKVDKPLVSGNLMQYRFTTPTFSASGTGRELSTPNFSYVASDLKRILFLTALAICAQLVLWYFLRR